MMVRKLQRLPDGFKISDYDNCVLPVVSAMVAYHPYMSKARQVVAPAFPVNYLVHAQYLADAHPLLLTKLYAGLDDL